MFGRSGKIIMAHRGASAYERENTLRAFERAIELGADVVEFDVRKTADHVLIVHHDEKIRGRIIRELPYADVGRLAGRGGFHVPMLEEVLILARGRIGLNAELKEQGYEADVAALMASVSTAPSMPTGAGAPDVPPVDPPIVPQGLRPLVLPFDLERYEALTAALPELRREWGVETNAELFLAVVRAAADEMEAEAAAGHIEGND